MRRQSGTLRPRAIRATTFIRLLHTPRSKFRTVFQLTPEYAPSARHEYPLARRWRAIVCPRAIVSRSTIEELEVRTYMYAKRRANPASCVRRERPSTVYDSRPSASCIVRHIDDTGGAVPPCVMEDRTAGPSRAGVRSARRKKIHGGSNTRLFNLDSKRQIFELCEERKRLEG